MSGLRAHSQPWFTGSPGGHPRNYNQGSEVHRETRVLGKLVERPPSPSWPRLPAAQVGLLAGPRALPTAAANPRVTCCGMPWPGSATRSPLAPVTAMSCRAHPRVRTSEEKGPFRAEHAVNIAASYTRTAHAHTPSAQDYLCVWHKDCCVRQGQVAPASHYRQTWEPSLFRTQHTQEYQ